MPLQMVTVGIGMMRCVRGRGVLLGRECLGLWVTWSNILWDFGPHGWGPKKSPTAFTVSLVLAASQDRGASWARGVFSPGKNRKEMKGSRRLQTIRGSLLITADTVLDGLWGVGLVSALQNSLSGIRGIKEPALLNSQ